LDVGEDEMGLGVCRGAFNMDGDGDGDWMRRAEEGEDAGGLDG